MAIKKFFSFSFFKKTGGEKSPTPRKESLAPKSRRKLNLWQIEKEFENLGEEEFEFTVPIDYIKNGMAVNLTERTVGFQKNCVPYNFTTLHFVEQRFFHLIKNRGSWSRIKFITKARAKEMCSDGKGIKTLELTVLRTEEI